MASLSFYAKAVDAYFHPCSVCLTKSSCPPGGGGHSGVVSVSGWRGDSHGQVSPADHGVHGRPGSGPGNSGGEVKLLLCLGLP